MDPLSEHISEIRTNYTLAALSENEVGDHPVAFFEKWFAEAERAHVSEVNAMALATVDSGQKPHCRIVLLKEIADGSFVFFTNYNSHKGEQIASHQEVALTFFWKELQRQVRIEGIARRVSAAISDEYFHSRPVESQIGAWASEQSRKIEARSVLEQRNTAYTAMFNGKEVPRPEHWGGYAVMPRLIEFWQGRSSRLHDRIVFEKRADGSWEKYRIAP